MTDELLFEYNDEGYRQAREGLAALGVAVDEMPNLVKMLVWLEKKEEKR